ncbi:MAG TPA: right-handed parallel beta-helix repeat-containing protein, partial [Chitinophagaceae bacterium]|nr:right-handed parallel beta-helix repeat-containing protein [Chitinophagaceae bacterium]
YGPHSWIKKGWDGTVVLPNGVHHPVIISLQPPYLYARPVVLKKALDFIVNRYRVRRNSLHIAGLSQGSWVANTFATYMPRPNDNSYGRMVKSIVNVQGVTPSNVFDAMLPYPQRFAHWASLGGHQLGFEQQYDFRDIKKLVNNMNSGVSGSATYFQTKIGDGKHSNFNAYFDPGANDWTTSNKAVVSIVGSPLRMNIYQWMLLQGDTSKGGSSTGPRNQAPEVHAGANQTITFPASSVTLEGSATDADGKIDSYEWTKLSGPLTYTISHPNKAETKVSNLLPGTYVFQLTATDNKGASATSTVTITVKLLNINKAPEANAGRDQTITLPNNSVTLNGSGTDEDGTLATYKWRKVSGPTTFTMDKTDASLVHVTKLVKGVYQFELVVTDNQGATDTDIIVVQVNGPVAPPQNDCGCNFLVQPGNDGGITLDGAKMGVKPGDKVCFKAGKYKYVNIANFNGTAAKPITFVNCGGQVVVGGYTYGFVITRSSFFRFTGTGVAGLEYGFKVDGTGARLGTGFAASTGSTEFEVDHLEITRTEVGVMAKTTANCDPISWEANFTARNLSFHDIYVHDVTGEGFYIGPTTINVTFTCNGKTMTQGSPKIHGLKIYNCTTVNTGWDGIQVASTPVGCEVFDNTVKNFGTAKHNAQQGGIIIGGLTSGKCYNNYIEKGTGNGIQVFGVGKVEVFNNVVVDAGQDGSATGQDGIFIDDRPVAGYPALYVDVTNNTVVNPGFSGIRLENSKGSMKQTSRLYNNLVVAPGAQSAANAFIAVRNKAPYEAKQNQFVKKLAEAAFVNAAARDFHLTATSPALNAGLDVRPLGITKDKEGRNRFLGLSTDAGAYECDLNGVPGNKAPVANAGSDKTLTLPLNNTTLTGSATDADGVVVSYSWKKVSGPFSGYIASPTKAESRLTSLAAGVYRFELEVTDDKGATGTDTVTITV